MCLNTNPVVRACPALQCNLDVCETEYVHSIKNAVAHLQAVCGCCGGLVMHGGFVMLVLGQKLISRSAKQGSAHCATNDFK